MKQVTLDLPGLLSIPLGPKYFVTLNNRANIVALLK